jgi:SAM-dependent methyltransferase
MAESAERKVIVPNYLATNAHFWSGIYEAPNVESFIFRFYGRILKFDYGIDGTQHERLLDFGCGQGGALRYFDKLGFNCFGVDIASNDIAMARRNLPHIANQIMLIDNKPHEGKTFFGGGFDIVISIQTLDFLSDTDFHKVIQSLYNSMKPGSKIYASMNGYSHYYRDHSEYVGDGLWHVRLKTNRLEYDLYNHFVRDKQEMKERFSLFAPIYIDHYDSSFREEGSEFRYTFFGVKK